MQPTNVGPFVACALLVLPVATQAATLGGHVETGIEYDSNLTVNELDQASGKSDQALVVGAGAEASGQPLENLTLTGTYDFTSRRYQSYESFDQDIHLASVDLSYQIDSVTLGASHYYSYATLASESFLDYNRSSLYVGKQMDDDVYVMASLLSKRKSFDQSEARDARTRGVSLDGFFFYNQSRTLFVLGLDGDDENASSDAYDYRMVAGRARLKHRFSVSGHDNTFQLGVRYEARDYDEPVSSVQDPVFPVFGPGVTSSEPRSDRIVTADVSWAVGLTDWLTTKATLERIDYRSTLDSADYDKTVASLTLRADF